MYFKTLALFFSLCFIANPLLAQSDLEQNQSIFHLKSGSVLVGEIFHETEDKVLLRIKNGEVISFRKLEVDKYWDSSDIVVYSNGKFHATNGFFWSVGLGFNLENFFDESELVSSHLPFIYGLNLNRHWSIGLGLAFEFNEARISGFQIDTQFVPLFVFGRYYFIQSKKKPFIYSRIGFGFANNEEEFTSDNKGGIQYQNGIGIHFASRKRSRFNMSLGYHLQKTEGTESFIDPFGNEIRTEYNIWIRRIIFNFTMEFSGKRRKY